LYLGTYLAEQDMPFRDRTYTSFHKNDFYREDPMSPDDAIFVPPASSKKDLYVYL
jgi:hypothetical protein